MNLKRKRDRYSYPALALRSGRPCRFRTTMELDGYHHWLLNSRIRRKRIEGLFSVIYWGHVSGKNGKIKNNYALAKVRRAKQSPNFDEAMVAGSLSRAQALIRTKRYGQAVVELTEIPQLGFAFASKVCAFVSGTHCGVIDSVIVRQYPNFGFVTRNGYVRNISQNALAYNDYCRHLQRAARKLNLRGQRSRWRDRDGAAHYWRAVDVERAMYG